MDLNRAQILGNVVRDPESRTIPSGHNVSSFSVATNMVWNDKDGAKQEKVEFHNIVAWRRLADICTQYLKKGRKVYVEGRLQTRSWEDQNGVKKYRTEILAENVILLDRPSGGTNAAEPTSEAEAPQVPPEETAAPAAKAATDTASTPAKAATEEDEIDVNDIPF